MSHRGRHPYDRLSLSSARLSAGSDHHHFVVKRWILALAIALGVAVALAGVYFWIQATSITTDANECRALECGGPDLAFGSPRESTTSGGYHLYNFSTQSGGGGVVWGDLGFEIQTSTGGTYSPSGNGWNVTVFGMNGGPVAFWTVTAGGPAWTVGGNLSFWSQESVLVTSPPASNLTGDNLVVLGQNGGFAGSVTIAIP